MRIGLYVSSAGAGDLDAILARFERTEQRGFHTAWLGQVFEHDALTVLALAGRVTERIELGTWVVPTPPRHPSALAQQALTVQSACGGRLLLGIGVSHPAVVERRLGLSLARPLRHMQEYLAVLQPLLAGERVDHRGEKFRVALQLDPPDVAPPPVLLGALGPRMLALAGACADGAAIWLGGPRYLEELAIPRLREAAQQASRPAPRIACGLPIAVCADAARARASAEAFLAQSSRQPAYQRVLAREGASNPADVAILGDEAEVRRGLDRLARLGVTDFTAVTFPVEGDEGAASRTLDLLGEIARG